MAITIRQLMANETAGGRGLLAHEILTKQGRREGPIEDKCDTCGIAWPHGDTLDWDSLEWQCRPCAVATMLEARPFVSSDIPGNEV